MLFLRQSTALCCGNDIDLDLDDFSLHNIDWILKFLGNFFVHFLMQSTALCCGNDIDLDLDDFAWNLNRMEDATTTTEINRFLKRLGKHTYLGMGDDWGGPPPFYTLVKTKFQTQYSPHKPDLHFLMRKDPYFHVGYALKIESGASHNIKLNNFE